MYRFKNGLYNFYTLVKCIITSKNKNLNLFNRIIKYYLKDYHDNSIYTILKLILDNIIDDTYYFDNFCELYKTLDKDLYDTTIDLNNLKNDERLKEQLESLIKKIIELNNSTMICYFLNKNLIALSTCIKIINDVIRELQESKNTEKLSACIQTIKEVTKTCNNPQILQLLKN